MFKKEVRKGDIKGFVSGVICIKIQKKAEIMSDKSGNIGNRFIKVYKFHNKAGFLSIRALTPSCRNDKGFLLFNDTILWGQGSINKSKETTQSLMISAIIGGIYLWEGIITLKKIL